MNFKPYIITVSAIAFLSLNATAPAQIVQNHNSDAPVTFDAGRAELLDRSNRGILSGGVIVTQAGLTLRSSRLTIAYSDARNIDIDRLDAIGGVTITKANLRTKSDAAIYDLNSNLITLIGNVSVTQGANKLNGGRIIIDLNQNRTSVEAAPQSNGQAGRVTGTFSVPQRSKNNETDDNQTP